MSWTTPPTYTVGEILTSASMNTYIRDNENSMPYVSGAQTLGASAAAITFQNIPAGKVLRAYFKLRSDSASLGVNASLTCNQDSGSHYNYVYNEIHGSTSTVAEANPNTSFYCGRMPAASAVANWFGYTVVEVMDFASTTTFKPITVRAAGPQDGTAGDIYGDVVSGHFQSTSAITRIDLSCSPANWVANSFAELEIVQ